MSLVFLTYVTYLAVIIKNCILHWSGDGKL